jgi:dTDP-4-amino-4,6-dideoxygalactose transaminase
MNLPSRNTPPDLQNSQSPKWRVPLSEPSFTEDEVESVMQTLRSGWWTSGPQVNALEREFESQFGIRHAIAVSSCTAALHLAFLAMKPNVGDGIVTPSFTFIAATNMMLHSGAVPQFADVDSLDCPQVSVESIERAIGPNTRGICVMHYGGYPCRMDSIINLAKQRNLWVVEDVAHAPGASFKGIQCGKWGDVACFSFFGNKNLTCAEGGIVATENDELAQEIRLMRSHGMTSLTWDRYRGHSFSYDVHAPGFNYRMDDLRAAILRVQLRSLDHFNGLRRERVQWYRKLLSGDSRWTITFNDHEGTSAYHLFTVVLGNSISRKKVMEFMKSRGIQTSIHYPPIHQFSCYQSIAQSSSELKWTNILGQQTLTLPLYPGLTYDQVELVCKTFQEAVQNGEENGCF